MTYTKPLALPEVYFAPSSQMPLQYAVNALGCFSLLLSPPA